MTTAKDTDLSSTQFKALTILREAPGELSSVDVAKKLKMTPKHTRQVLWELVEANKASGTEGKRPVMFKAKYKRNGNGHANAPKNTRKPKSKPLLIETSQSLVEARKHRAKFEVQLRVGDALVTVQDPTAPIQVFEGGFALGDTVVLLGRAEP